MYIFFNSNVLTPTTHLVFLGRFYNPARIMRRRRRGQTWFAATFYFLFIYNFFFIFYLFYKAVIVGVFSHCTCTVARNHIIVVTRSSHIFLFPPSRTCRRPTVVNYLHYVRRIIIIIMYKPLSTTDSTRSLHRQTRHLFFYFIFFALALLIGTNRLKKKIVIIPSI